MSTWQREELLARYEELVASGAKPKVEPTAVDPEVEKVRLELERKRMGVRRKEND